MGFLARSAFIELRVIGRQPMWGEPCLKYAFMVIAVIYSSVNQFRTGNETAGGLPDVILTDIR